MAGDGKKKPFGLGLLIVCADWLIVCGDVFVNAVGKNEFMCLFMSWRNQKIFDFVFISENFHGYALFDYLKKLSSTVLLPLVQAVTGEWKHHILVKYYLTSGFAARYIILGPMTTA